MKKMIQSYYKVDSGHIVNFDTITFIKRDSEGFCAVYFNFGMVHFRDEGLITAFKKYKDWKDSLPIEEEENNTDTQVSDEDLL